MTTRLLRAAAAAPALYRTSALRTLAPPRLTASHLRPALSSARAFRDAASRQRVTEEPSSSSAPLSPKVEALVEQIASLSLLEAAELTEALKVCFTNFFLLPPLLLWLCCVCVCVCLTGALATFSRYAQAKLGISSAMMAPAAGAAPAAGGAPAAAAEEAAPAAEKTHFTIKLEKFDAGSKIKLIKEVRAYTGLGLKEAKELVEARADGDQGGCAEGGGGEPQGEA